MFRGILHKTGKSFKTSTFLLLKGRMLKGGVYVWGHIEDIDKSKSTETEEGFLSQLASLLNAKIRCN